MARKCWQAHRNQVPFDYWGRRALLLSDRAPLEGFSQNHPLSEAMKRLAEEHEKNED
jgi:hypothetical protein